MNTKIELETSVNEKLKSMENRLSTLEDKLSSIDTKLNQVVEAILGNPLTKMGGFVQDIECLKKEVETLKTKNQENEDFRKKLIWLTGIIVAGALIVEYLINLYTSLAK